MANESTTLFNPDEFKYYHREDYGFLDYHLLQLLSYLEKHADPVVSAQFTLKQLERANTTQLITIDDIRRFKNVVTHAETAEDEFQILELIGTIFAFYLISCRQPQEYVVKNTLGFLFASNPTFKQVYLQSWNNSAFTS